MPIPEDLLAEGDSPETIQAIIQALESLGHRVIGIEADDRALARLKAASPDLVFNIAEGLYGDFRESYIPLLCERLGIPYTGSDPLTLGICLNKARTKEILGYHGIPTAPFCVISDDSEIDRLIQSFPFPILVKPIAEGSSKGIFNASIIEDPKEAKERIRTLRLRYGQSVLVEKYLEGEELTAALWGNGDAVEVLPLVAIRFDALPPHAYPIYSYEAKWVWDTPEKPLDLFECPASIASSLMEEVITLVKKTWRVLGIRDWCRIDIRFDHDVPHILEVNPLPGILPKPEDNSCFPKAARTAGYTYPQMLEHLLTIACERWGIPYGCD